MGFRCGWAPPKARALLGYLALHAGEVVSTDRLIGVLWAERPPASAAHALQVYVAGLRGALEPERPPGAEAEVLRTRRPGYLLAVQRNQVDVHRFEVLVEQGRRYAASGRPERAVATFREGRALWRGGVMADLAAAPFVGVAAAHLEELRVAAVEDCLDARVGDGPARGGGGRADRLGPGTSAAGAVARPADGGVASVRAAGRRAPGVP